MPLLKYFGFVGSVLLMLLLGANWYFPEPITELVHNGIDKSAIRISSIEKLPERIVIDTSLPTIVPAPSVIDTAVQPPQAAFAQIAPGPLPAVPTAGDGIPKKQNAAKRNALKKVTTHRPASPLNLTAAKGYAVQIAEPVTQISLMDLIRERFGQSFSS